MKDFPDVSVVNSEPRGRSITPDLVMLPFLFQIESLSIERDDRERLPGSPRCRISVDAHVVDVETGQPRRITFYQSLPPYIYSDQVAVEVKAEIIKAILMTMMEHELDEVLRRATGEHVKDPHATTHFISVRLKDPG